MSEKGIWVSPLKYTTEVGKSKQHIYLQIRLGKLKSRKVTKTAQRLEIFVPAK